MLKYFLLQHVNPLLLMQMKENHLSNDTMSMIQQIKNFAASIKIGNISAFKHFLKTNRMLVTKPAAKTSAEDKNLEGDSTLAIELSSDEEATQPTEKQLSKIKQFVEVLTEAEKPTALLNLIQHLLCGNSKYSKSKVLVFATLSNVDMLYDYLNKYGRESTVAFPTVLTIPEGVKDEVRCQILSLFQHGILLISPYNFLNKMNQTGELTDFMCTVF
jgi:hypothetical protein